MIRIITDPTIAVLADMHLDEAGLATLTQWLSEAAPACLPDQWQRFNAESLLFTHLCERTDGSPLTHNELLVELSGRKCYNSFGQKAGRSENDAYIANTMGAPGKIPHASIMYHAKMTFFFAGISRRMSHELIRHYVGADRSEEGCPSQESTRYTEHPGHFVAHPRVAKDADSMTAFSNWMTQAYDAYLKYLEGETYAFSQTNGGEAPRGMDRKRIYEAAAMLLPGAAATSMIWTTNPVALAKLFAERCDEAADLEFQRFATKLREVCYAKWPNLYRASNPACSP